MTNGWIDDIHFDNPFVRFHEMLEKNNHHLDDWDDVSMTEYDNWERFKPFKAKKGTTVGSTPIIPYEDNDQKLQFFDFQGESLFTNPPDGNIPAVDHELDEEHIWAF